ncbi:MAG: anthranilate phosphoribosyltransferase [Candidatus Schekmanbacteria bacterium]|nr:MAG: anthranilate phosphoribosyltransferase [Candidatus Schekmanbacteria bacterium]
MLKKCISKLANGNSLSEEEAYLAIKEILKGKATHSQIASFLTALTIKGESLEEIIGAVKAMREMAVTIKLNDVNAVDTCGTGGDASGTFNISTTAAIVAAGAGVTVAKHGNRSVSSRCGSADILEKMGVKVNLSPEKVAKCIDEIGIGFMFAPQFHSAMKYAAPVRKEIGIRTIFNILGPLSNPAEVRRQVVGVFSEKVQDLYAETLLRLGIEKAYIVHSDDGLDEISVCAETRVLEINKGKISDYRIAPEDFGMMRHRRDEIIGDNAEINRDIIIRILKGAEGGKRDIVLLNAAAAIAASGRVESMEEGLEIAKESINSGKAEKKLQDMIAFTNRV